MIDDIVLPFSMTESALKKKTEQKQNKTTGLTDILEAVLHTTDAKCLHNTHMR